MNRHRLPPLGYAMALAAMMQTIERTTPRVKPLPNVPDHRPSAKKWTCKRCGEKFTPHRSPTYCDRCQAARMGENHPTVPTYDFKAGAQVLRDFAYRMQRSGNPREIEEAMELHRKADVLEEMEK